MIRDIVPGAMIYKRDLKQAYRQFPVDPSDYRYLGYYWEVHFYFDTVLAMGQRNAAMACSRSTAAIMYIHRQYGYSGASYLDDLIGVSSPLTANIAYESLHHLLLELGLEENSAKACAPSSCQVVLGILIDTRSMTLSITAE